MSIRNLLGPLAVLTVSATALALSTGCALKGNRPLDPIPSELYASGSVYLYQPLNPTTIWVRDPERLKPGETAADITSPAFKDALLRDLDTETLRISLSKLGGSASVGIAVVGTSITGESYVLTVDYIKYFTSNQPVNVTYDSTSRSGIREERRWHGFVPIYAGVGVRIRAEFVALETGVDIAGLPALAVAANGNAVSGRLTVQTLGITGPEITGLMPIISDISVGSIQSAVQAAAAIKAKLYEDSTVAYPKIVGFEVPATRVEAIPTITEALYESELEVAPRVGPNPEHPEKRLLWIAWFPEHDDDGEVERALAPGATAARETARDVTSGVP